MTIMDVISRIDETKPNSYSQEEKVKWLSTLDGIIKSEIIDTHKGGEDIEYNGYNPEDNLYTELIVKPPYDDIYLRWIESQIDYANGEFDRYNISLAAYNDMYSAFSHHYSRTHVPKGSRFIF